MNDLPEGYGVDEYQDDDGDYFYIYKKATNEIVAQGYDLLGLIDEIQRKP